MTNFERIKNMSADELAAFLEKTSISIAIKLNGTYTIREKNSITEWLESEVTE